MTNTVVQELNEQKQLICANIDCRKILAGFDITNNKRFCRMCRMSNKLIRWVCKGCGSIMSNDHYREGRKFCDVCAERVPKENES